MRLWSWSESSSQPLARASFCEVGSVGSVEVARLGKLAMIKLQMATANLCN